MSAAEMTPQTRAWLDQPALARLWDRLRDRLERGGLQVRGRLRLDGVTAAEREALALLTGRPYTGDAVSIALPDLDAQLRTGAAERGLVEVVAELRGPLTDRPAARDARRAAAEAVWAAADHALRSHGLADAAWSGPWLEEVRRAGTLARLAPENARRLIVQAIDVMALLAGPASSGAGLASGSPGAAGLPGRGELAERVTGTAHGLDDGTLLARIVLRAVARSLDVAPPQDARSRRELWEAAGVAVDRVSTTVLTHGLAPLGDEPTVRLLRDRTRAGFETHLTLRDLNRMTWRLPPDTEVFVCENPRVVEAAADRGCTRPLVCVSGNPTTTALTLLDALHAAGARLAYRGDFDWPGIAIANRMIGRYAARPWRMRATDYEQHVATARDRGTPLPPLTGAPVDAVWDPELTPAMTALGVAVQEESALELLLADLLSPEDPPA
ncbi:TIGR02679 family protein [Actinoallomurus purpureus]|uniref:TIGR02679 family protein n=1 Tax=Actinoallomurus purpureus TaxID=478114 RepID=UPI002093BBEC|nr:TIGR02679 family protein [Actinoallomurus purpureus]MCO6008320.1 TIGR02679 family protein [Actinoallomurus purpureus]